MNYWFHGINFSQNDLYIASGRLLPRTVLALISQPVQVRFAFNSLLTTVKILITLYIVTMTTSWLPVLKRKSSFTFRAAKLNFSAKHTMLRNTIIIQL